MKKTEVIHPQVVSQINLAANKKNVEKLEKKLVDFMEIFVQKKEIEKAQLENFISYQNYTAGNFIESKMEWSTMKNPSEVFSINTAQPIWSKDITNY